MPKLREILTEKEHQLVGGFRIKMLDAPTACESDYYRYKIESIFSVAKDRYFNRNNSEKDLSCND